MNLRPVVKRYTVDSHHSMAPRETVAVALGRLGPDGLGLVQGVERIPDVTGAGIPVYRPASRDAGNEWGKGLMADQGQASAVMEFVERYSASTSARLRKADLRFCRRSALTGRSLGWDALTPCNLHYFLLRDIASADDRNILWAKSFSLTHRQEAWLPASRVFLALDQPEVPDFTNSNGLSASNTLEEAIVQGLSELVERHVFHLFYLNGTRAAPRIDLASVKNECLARALAELERRGYAVLANDHSSGFPLATVSTLIYKPGDDIEYRGAGCYVHFGCAPDAEVALIRCVTEAIQSKAVATLRHAHVRADAGRVHDSVARELEWRTGQRTVALADLPGCAAADFRDEIEALVAAFAARDLEILVTDVTHPHLGIPVVRVTCPGLQPNFLPMHWPIDGFKAAVSHHVNGHARIHEDARRGRFYEQHVFDCQGGEGGEPSVGPRRLPCIARVRSGERFDLPPPSAHVARDLGEVLASRRSSRRFGPGPDRRQLSDLLHHAVGHHAFEFSGRFGIVQKRAYASAGARHSLEFQMWCEGSADLPAGVYHCAWDCSHLVRLRELPDRASRAALFPGQEWAGEAPCVMFITTLPRRIGARYPGSEERFALLEAGQAAQNLSLMITALGLASTALRDWSDERVCDLLGIDGADERPVYVLALG